MLQIEFERLYFFMYFSDCISFQNHFNNFLHVLQYIFVHKIWKQIHKCNLKRSLNTFGRELKEGKTTWKSTFWGGHSFYITQQRCIYKSKISNQLLKLIWEKGIRFYAGTFKSDQNAPDIWQSNLLKTEIGWSNFWLKPL